MIKIVLIIFLSSTILLATTLNDAIYIHKTKGSIRAIPLYKELVYDNNTEAMNALAKIFIKGDGVKINIPRAYRLLLKSSDLNNLEAQYMLGKLYQSEKSPYFNPYKAYNAFVKSANDGFAKSQEMVGKYFLYGKTVDKNYEKALFYFMKASKQRLYSSNCYIAYMYASGSGVFPNFGRAHVFAKDQYEKGNKFCKKVWDDYNLQNYTDDKGWKVGDYLEPIK